jgi:hypothetical protein
MSPSISPPALHHPHGSTVGAQPLGECVRRQKSFAQGAGLLRGDPFESGAQMTQRPIPVGRLLQRSGTGVGDALCKNALIDTLG